MPPSPDPQAYRMQPMWLRGSAALIRRLPAGRSLAAAWLAGLVRAPFVARTAPSLGQLLFVCDLQDEIARDVCLLGGYEPQVSRALTALVSRGATVVDVGANWGYFTLLAAHLTGPGGRVLALEPDRRPFALLERNCALNRLACVTSLPVAAGRGREELVLDGYADAATNRGVSRTRHREAGARADLPVVPAAALDELLDDQGVAAVDLVKIDVEGAEDGVLEGMSKGLAAGRYRRVLLELHPGLLAERGLTPDDCCTTLRAAGYLGWAFDHTPAAVRRAVYARDLSLADLIGRTDRVPEGDPWPHMLWTLPTALPF
jgi:FkbM family methyltransferase